MTIRIPRHASGARAGWSPEPVTDLFPDWFSSAIVLAGLFGGASVVGAVLFLPARSTVRGARHTVRLQTEARRQAIDQARAQSAGIRPAEPGAPRIPTGDSR